MKHEFAFLSVEDAIILHAFVIGVEPEHGRPNVLDIGLLESALNRPRQRYFYEDADIEALAATLLWGLVQNHAFYDGNKRTAWVATQLFLYRNGYDLPYDNRSIRLVLSIATGRKNVDQVETWIRSRMRPARQRRMFF